MDPVLINVVATSCMLYKKVCYRWQHRAPRVIRETRILPIGVGDYRPKLYGNGFNGVIQSIDTVW